MTKELRQYFRALDLTQKAYIARVEHAVKRIESATGERIQMLIVEDLITEEGTRSYLHLAAFTDSYLAAVTDFLDDDTVSVYPLHSNVRKLSISTADYEFGQVTDASRIYVEFTLGADQYWELQGTGHNCERIWDAVRTRLRPNLVGST